MGRASPRRRTKNGWQPGKAFTKERGNRPLALHHVSGPPLPLPAAQKMEDKPGRSPQKKGESFPLRSNLFVSRPSPSRPHKKWKARGEGVDARKGILPLALHYVCGPPLPSRAHEEWEANGEAVRKKGRPLRCAPICLRGAHFLAGVRRLGDKWGRSSQKKGETFSLRPNLFVGRPPLRGRAESGGQKGKAFAEEMGNLPRCPPLCLRAAPLPPGRAKNGREAGKEFAKEKLVRPYCL